jgi:hypothetical protein
LESVEPNKAQADQSVDLVIKGGIFNALVHPSFRAGSETLADAHFEIWVGDKELAESAMDSRTQLSAHLPPGGVPGFYDLRVVAPDGQSATLKDAFEITEPGSVNFDAGSNVVDSGPQPQSDGGAAEESGPGPSDSGPAPLDGGPAPADSGPVLSDSGPAPADSGPVLSDSGPAPADSGMDGGSFVLDGGADANDGGGVDSGIQACPDNDPCDDGDLCTQTDTCQGGICVGSNPVVCTALDACHDVGICVSATGLCTDPIRSVVCGDAEICGTEICDDGINDGSLGQCGSDCLADPPAQLSFSAEPNDVVLNTPISPAVAITIEDSAGRRVKGSTLPIALVLDTDPSGGAATLSGGNALAATDGIASFSALQLDQAAAGYTLSATSSPLSPATSATFAVTDPNAGPWPPALDAWQYRKAITLLARMPNAVLTDFPVLISLVDTDLRDGALATGNDITFGTFAGAVLEHQVEDYDNATGTLTAWVKIPSLDTATDTVLYMYYGNAAVVADPSLTSVWSNGFEAVWHLNDVGSGSADEFTDHSGNGHAGTGGGGGGGAGNSTPARAAGHIGWGQLFDGNNDYIESTSQMLNNQTKITLSMWVFLNADDNGDRPGLAGQNNLFEMGFFWVDRINLWSPGITDNCPGKGIVSLCTPDYTLSQWFHLVVSWDGTEIVMYVDGIEKHRVPLSTLGTSTYSFNLGGEVFDPGTSSMDGLLDEVRVATTDRTGAWIAIEHANQVEPAAFYSVGLQEVHP